MLLLKESYLKKCLCLVIKESVTNDQHKFSISFNLKWKEIKLPVFLKQHPTEKLISRHWKTLSALPSLLWCWNFWIWKCTTTLIQMHGNNKTTFKIGFFNYSDRETVMDILNHVWPWNGFPGCYSAIKERRKMSTFVLIKWLI